MVLAGLLAARRARGGLHGDRFLLMGAGAAAIGIARMIVAELVACGIDRDDARSRVALLDHRGLVHRGRPGVADDQLPFAVDLAALSHQAGAPLDPADVVSVARAHRATALIGATGCAGAFSEALVGEVASHDPAPIVLPISNPSSCAEATAEDILAWTAGRAYVATGSPSRDVEGPLGRRVIGQANNVFIFPGVGLGSIVARSAELTDEVFRVAAHRLTDMVTPDRVREGALYPRIAELRSVARAIAIAVAEHARACDPRAEDEEPVPALVDRAMWWPAYLPLVSD